MKRVFRFLLLLLLIAPALPVLAQADSIKQADSVNTAGIRNYKLQLETLEQQRLADSVKKVQLQQQLQSLQTTDNLKKEQLQQQLKALNSREAQRIADKKARIDSLRATAKGYPVTGFFKDTLFTIYSKLGSFSARDRANAISERIQVLGDDYLFSGDSLKVIPSENTVDVMAGST